MRDGDTRKKKKVKKRSMQKGGGRELNWKTPITTSPPPEKKGGGAQSLQLISKARANRIQGDQEISTRGKKEYWKDGHK